jgi:hypothetical protein
MADETTSSGGAPAANTEDPIKQVKSEFSRKTDNIASQLSQQQAKIDQIMNAVIAQQQAMARPAPTAEKDIDPIDDPKGFAKKIAADAARTATEQVMQYSQSQSQQQASQQQVLNALVQDYPELNDRSSELFIKAQEIQATMSAEERYNPTAIRAAVREAAGEVGLLPMKKRTNKGNVDDFTVDSSGSSPNTAQRRQAKETELAPETLAFAEAIGMNINDPKYLASLKKVNQRKNWGKFK